EIIKKHITGAPFEVSNDFFPPEIRQIIDKATETNREKRFQTMDEFSEALTRATGIAIQERTMVDSANGVRSASKPKFNKALCGAGIAILFAGLATAAIVKVQLDGAGSAKLPGQTEAQANPNEFDLETLDTRYNAALDRGDIVEASGLADRIVAIRSSNSSGSPTSSLALARSLDNRGDCLVLRYNAAEADSELDKQGGKVATLLQRAKDDYMKAYELRKSSSLDEASIELAQSHKKLGILAYLEGDYDSASKELVSAITTFEKGDQTAQ